MAELVAVGLLAFCLGVTLGWYAWGVGGHSAEGSGKGPTPVAMGPASPVGRPEPIVREEPRRMAKAPEPWRVAFYSGSGRRCLGKETRFDRRQPTLKYRGMDGLLGVYQVSGQEATGEWVYRRVAVERE